MLFSSVVTAGRDQPRAAFSFTYTCAYAQTDAKRLRTFYQKILNRSLLRELSDWRDQENIMQLSQSLR